MDDEVAETTDDAAVTEDYSDIDFGQFGVTEAAETDPASTDIPSATAPAEKTPDVWGPVLEALPDDATRAMIKPHLAEWERNTTQRFQQIHQQYAPWKGFQDQGISPEDLQMRYALTQQIDADPLAFYERLKGALVQQGRLQEAQVVQDKIDAETEEQEIDPIQAMQAQQQQFFQQIEQQRIADQQRDIARQADEQTDAELAALETKHGALSPVFKRELFQRAMIMNQQSGRYIPLEQAFNSLQEFIRLSRQTSPGQRAPRVVPSGGGLPAPVNKPNSQLSPDERMAKAEAVIQRMQEGAS